GITRQTLHAIERGAPSVGMGNYAMVLFVLGLEKDLLRVGADTCWGASSRTSAWRPRSGPRAAAKCPLLEPCCLYPDNAVGFVARVESAMAARVSLRRCAEHAEARNSLRYSDERKPSEALASLC